MDLLEQLERLSHPAFQAALLAIFGMGFLRRHRRIALASLLSATFWIWLCSTPAFAIWLQQGLVPPYAHASAADYPAADAIVILGGGKLPQTDADWSATDDQAQATRLGFGLQLLKSSRAGTILLSGNDQAQEMTRKLRQKGVPPGMLLTEPASANTHQNALYSAAILEHKQLHRILLVTSDIHMPRASSSFAKQGLAVIPAPVFDPDGISMRTSRSWWPSRAALRLSARCLREHLGLWCYRLRGWA
jgi:uncharacterized SAM-binding protein YcdF (DUF218 family)